MSELTQEREQELVTGIIESVIVKGEGKWQVVVRPDGSQYTKNLWTKSESQASAATAKIGQHGAFPCSVSHWTNSEGKPVRSLWLESIEEDGAQNPQNATPDARPSAAPVEARPSSEGMTPEKWDAKERRDYRSRAWAQTISAFQHTIKVDEKPEDVFVRLQPFQRKVYEDITGMFAYPADESDVPF